MPRSDRLRIFSSLETIDGDRLAALLGACPNLDAFTANVTEVPRSGVCVCVCVWSFGVALDVGGPTTRHFSRGAS